LIEVSIEAPGASAELLGESEGIRRARERLVRLAPLDTPVLIHGETGTGKGLAARLLHDASRRAGPFVHADCASLSRSLFESELFGHERGAFTGAVARRVGRLERSAGGTLFLDEIGELDARLQATLLRVLQDRRFERVGGGETLPLRGRVVAATSRDLRREVRCGRFRADLYYRIAVAHLPLPPLRERPGDVARLAGAALPRIAQRLGLAAPEPSRDALRKLCDHPWPGNVRELENALERLVILWAGRPVGACDVEAVLEEDLTPAGSAPGPEQLARTLEACGGNVTAAARRLGLPRTTLRRRLAREAG
jgi:DNA-binding NtrC family response regulator